MTGHHLHCGKKLDFEECSTTNYRDLPGLSSSSSSTSGRGYHSMSSVISVMFSNLRAYVPVRTDHGLPYTHLPIKTPLVSQYNSHLLSNSCALIICTCFQKLLCAYWLLQLVFKLPCTFTLVASERIADCHMRDLSPAIMEPEGLRLREVSTAGASNEGDGKTIRIVFF